MATIAQELADWSHNLRYEDVPTHVIEDAKTRIIDTLGVSLAARDSDIVNNIRKTVGRLTPGVASDRPNVIGFGDSLPATSAALLNGTMAHALDFDDTHTEANNHVSGPVTGAMISLAGADGSQDGREVLLSTIIGREVTCRVGLGAPGGLWIGQGFHPTGLLGAFGVAAQAGRVAGLNGEQIANAFAICGSQAAGISESFAADGNKSGMKRMHGGWAAHSGIWAAALAADGVAGPPSVFEGRMGFFNTHMASPQKPYDGDLGRVTANLDSDWEGFRVAYKPYPCCVAIHPFLEAMESLQEAGLKHEDIVSIKCHVASWMIPFVCEPVAEKVPPKTPYHAKFSIQFSMAASLIRGRVDSEAYSPEVIGDPRITELAKKVTHQLDTTAPDSHQLRGWIVVELANGTRMEKIVEPHRGSEGNPMTRDDIIQKFHRNLGNVLPESQRLKLIDAIENFESIDDVCRLSQLSAFSGVNAG